MKFFTLYSVIFFMFTLIPGILNANDEKSLGKKKDGTPYQVIFINASKSYNNQLESILNSEGFKIIGISTESQNGVLLYNNLYSKIDLVFIDSKMPMIDGVSVVEKILDFDKTAKIVIVSKMGESNTIKHFLSIGAKSFIEIPFVRQKVIERLRLILK